MITVLKTSLAVSGLMMAIGLLSKESAILLPLYALALEVTHVARSEDAFARLRSVAFALAQSMEGVVTDDNGQPLAPELMDRIGADLEGLYDALDAHDLSAGSPQARRLFS